MYLIFFFQTLGHFLDSFLVLYHLLLNQLAYNNGKIIIILLKSYTM